MLYREGRYELLSGDGFLDPEVVDRFGPSGVTYTPHRDEAVATVDRGEAEAAFLLRPTAHRGRLGRRAAGRSDAAEEHVLLSQAHFGPLAAAA